MIIEVDNIVYDVIVTRRRYGKQMFTWINAFKSPEGVYCGPPNDMWDPFPCITPKKAELKELLKLWMKKGIKWIYKDFDRIFVN